MFKNLKYNFIIIMFMLLISVAAVLNTQFFDKSIPSSEIIYPNDQPTTPGEHGSQENPPPLDNKENEKKDTHMPSSRYPMQVINYCLEKLYNSSGYYETINFVTKISGNVAGVYAEGNQLAAGYVIKSGQSRYEEMKMQALDEISLKFSPYNFAQATFTDDGGQTNHFWKTNKDEFDLSKGKYEVWTAQNNPNYRRWYYDFIYPDLFGVPKGAIQFSNKNSQVSLSTQKNATTGRYEYIINVKLIDKDADYPEPLLRSYNSSVGIVSYNSVIQNITFKVDRETGWIKSYIKKDTFLGRANLYVAGADVKCELTYKANFSNFDQNIQIAHPIIPEAKKEA